MLSNKELLGLGSETKVGDFDHNDTWLRNLTAKGQLMEINTFVVLLYDEDA